MMKRKRKLPDYRVALQPGETHLFDGRLDAPEISIVGGGRAYLWVGGRGCVGTLNGAAMYRLAMAILGRVNPPPTRKRGAQP